LFGFGKKRREDGDRSLEIFDDLQKNAEYYENTDIMI
jgi:hypothetical protein